METVFLRVQLTVRVLVRVLVSAVATYRTSRSDIVAILSSGSEIDTCTHFYRAISHVMDGWIHVKGTEPDASWIPGSRDGAAWSGRPRDLARPRLARPPGWPHRVCIAPPAAARLMLLQYSCRTVSYCIRLYRYEHPVPYRIVFVRLLVQPARIIMAYLYHDVHEQLMH